MIDPNISERELSDWQDRLHCLRELADAAMLSQQAILQAYDESNRFHPQYDADLATKRLREGMDQLRADLEKQQLLYKKVIGET